jgi:hypothetical protein
VTDWEKAHRREAARIMGRRPLHVFAWQHHRAGVGQTREVMAAPSKAAVARALGLRRPTQVFNLCETRNAQEIAVAHAHAGKILSRGIYARADAPWTVIEPVTPPVEPGA